MSFTDTGTVDELHLAQRIDIEDDDKVWITGRVIELSYLDEEEMDDTRIVLQLDDRSIRELHRKPGALFVHNFDDVPDE